MLSRHQMTAMSATIFSQRSAMMLTSTPCRFFNKNLDKGAAKLAKALEKEIKYENENYTQLEDMDTFLQESGFEFHEEKDSPFLILKKKVGKKLVEVHFEARQPLPDDEQNPP
mmetsp:Transcript_20951/g.15373  ORF Transcript_20951/g.15373 Transcript_20951/m.15373 type:complete len:113 (+) Transcript_20951:50-388(+)